MALCILTFPLLWIGGLVTSTDAGMAVPDWPTTYGYNMFAYPWQTWFFGPWDLFIEHGHRLLASVVGLLTIACALSIRRSDQRPWLSWLALLAIVLVVTQGVLGGVRVIENQRVLAMVHGCTGPLFFALTAVLLAATSKAWQNVDASICRGAGGRLLALAILAYVQLCLGAQLRHAMAETSPWAFAVTVKLHLYMAGAVTLGILAAIWSIASKPGSPPVVSRLTVSLGLLLVVQLALGGLTWLVKYGSPGWAADLLPATMEANLADGLAQTHLATAHSACGSLIFGIATAAAAYALHFGAVQDTRQATGDLQTH